MVDLHCEGVLNYVILTIKCMLTVTETQANLIGRKLTVAPHSERRSIALFSVSVNVPDTFWQH